MFSHVNGPQGLHIAAKELIPIVLAGIIWGRDWKGRKVRVRCDNMAVVSALNRRYCQDNNLMQLLRCLSFIEARRQFSMAASHSPGIHNTLADDLSRNRAHSFLAEKPDADPNPTPIPPFLLQWLLDPSREWTSPIWMRMFDSYVAAE